MSAQCMNRLDCSGHADCPVSLVLPERMAFRCLDMPLSVKMWLKLQSHSSKTYMDSIGMPNA